MHYLILIWSSFVTLSVTRSKEKEKKSKRLKRTHDSKNEIIFLKNKIFSIQTNFIVDSFGTNRNKREKELVSSSNWNGAWIWRRSGNRFTLIDFVVQSFLNLLASDRLQKTNSQWVISEKKDSNITKAFKLISTMTSRSSNTHKTISWWLSPWYNFRFKRDTLSEATVTLRTVVTFVTCMISRTEFLV